MRLIHDIFTVGEEYLQPGDITNTCELYVRLSYLGDSDLLWNISSGRLKMMSSFATGSSNDPRLPCTADKGLRSLDSMPATTNLPFDYPACGR